MGKISLSSVKKSDSSWQKKLKLTAATLLIFSIGFMLGDDKINIGVSNGAPISVSQNQLNYSSVDTVYDLLKRNYDGNIDNQKALDGLKEGLAGAAGDEYTEYLTAEETKDFNSQLSGTFEGIGAELGKKDSSITIVAPLSGFPAEKAGLKPQDIIVKIDGQSAYDLTISEAVKKIRGPKDTVVKLTISRGDQEPFEVSITRAKISVPSVETKIEDDIGVLKISHFGTDTVSLAQKAAEEFKEKKVKGVVLDLRSNPGGYLEGAVDVASLWLDKTKTVVVEKSGGKVRKTHRANNNDPQLRGLPTVVIINEGSASASEIVAGALKDNGAAELVGKKSYGKGSVQQVESLLDGSSLKITIARWFTPKGNNIDKEGIKPDYELDAGEDISKSDPQKIKALELIRQKIQ